MTRCQARQYSDEMVCNACRLRWDTNDREPPPCGNSVSSPPLQPEQPKSVPFVSGLPAR
jgi:hypothetical protein